jgi:hypothetical protein
MGLFSRKDWNVIAVIFERHGVFQINGQRVKGNAADKARDGAKSHPRSVFWAVFDQKGAILESGPGAGVNNVATDVFKKLQRELPFNKTVQEVLKSLETGAESMLARSMSLSGPAPSTE